MQSGGGVHCAYVLKAHTLDISVTLQLPQSLQMAAAIETQPSPAATSPSTTRRRCWTLPLPTTHSRVGCWVFQAEIDNVCQPAGREIFNVVDATSVVPGTKKVETGD